MIRTANIRLLKDKLSAFLLDVQRGDVVLVTDRGRVIAEIRQPSLREHERGSAPDRWFRLIEEGTVQAGLPNVAAAYQPGELRLSAAVVDEALDQTRGPR